MLHETWFDQHPSHPVQTEAQRLFSRSEHYLKLYSDTIDTDPELACEYYSVAGLLRERANMLEFFEYCEYMDQLEGAPSPWTLRDQLLP